MSPTVPTGVMRTLGAVVMVMASMAFVACGDDENDGAGSKSGLGTDRYKQLDAVYTASLPLDEIDDDAPPSEMAKHLDHYSEPCEKLDADDALTGSYRRSCPLVADLREQLLAVDACEDESRVDECAKAVSETRLVIREALSRAEDFDAVVEREKLDPACQAALRNSELSYEVMRGLGRSFAYLERALKTGSEKDADTGERLLKEAEAKDERLPSAKTRRADFRAGCD